MAVNGVQDPLYELYIIMNRCEHGQKISKFCVTEHCHHRESAGCDYCIKKYHFHLTNTQLLLEADIENLLKTFTLPPDSKYKGRTFNEATLDYLRSLRLTVNSWVDAAQNAITERLSFPFLHTHALLPIYSKLKNKEYRKFTSPELKALSDVAKNSSAESIKKEELQLYFREVQWTWDLVDATTRLAQEIEALPKVKEGESVLPINSKNKLHEIYISIQRERQKRQRSVSKDSLGQYSSRKAEKSKSALNKMEEKVEPSSLMRRRIGDKESSHVIKQAVDRKLFVDTDKDKQLNFNRQKSVNRQKTTENAKTERLSEKPEERHYTNEQRLSRLKNRKASIDDGMTEIKFRGSDEIAKEIQERKRKLLESVVPKKHNEEQRQALNKTATESSEKPERIDLTVNFNSANSKTEKEGTSVRPVRAFESIRNHKLLNRDRSDRGTGQRLREDNNTTGISEMEKSDSSSRKASEKSIFDTLQAKGLNLPELINNILPPLPPTLPKPDTDAVMTNMIVRIPMGARQVSEQIQSPIFKNKRKMDKAQNQGAFAINLQLANQHLPVVHQAEKQESTPLPAVKSDHLSYDQNDTIVLDIKQKNSLLLFCEALKSESARAIELLRASLRYSPNNLSSAQYLSFLYLENGNAKQCLQVCQSILVLIEDKSDEFELTLHLHNNKAAALNMLGRYSESIVVLQKCLRFRRKHYFYKNLGDAYFSLGIPEKAAMNYDKAIRLDPGYDEAYYNLAVSQFIQQQYSSAKLNIEHALRIDNLNEAYLELSVQIGKRIESIQKG